MAIAKRVKWFLDAHHVGYEVLAHDEAKTARASAEAAHIPSGRVAKCVLLEDERGYVMAVVPASCRVAIDKLDQKLHRHLELATVNELDEIFDGCESGAIPPVGALYNIPTVVDQSLMRLPDVYFEGGNHEELMHVSGEAFRELLAGSSFGDFAQVQ